MINFDWIVNNLINCSSAANKLSELNKRVNTEAAAHRCSLAVSKNVVQNMCS